MSDVSQILQKLKSAVPVKEEGEKYSCPTCGGMDFQFIMHADGRDSFRDIFACKNCDTPVYREQKRSRMSRAYWS